MFENWFNKKISTKNLYYSALRYCVVKQSIPNKYFFFSTLYHYEFEVIKKVILVKKIRKNCYQDIFTKNIYKFEFDDCNIGDFFINATIPISISAPYITYSEAAELLDRINNANCDKDTVNNDSANSFQKKKTLINFD